MNDLAAVLDNPDYIVSKYGRSGERATYYRWDRYCYPSVVHMGSLGSYMNVQPLFKRNLEEHAFS